MKRIALLLGIVAAVLIGFLIGQKCPKNQPVEPISVKVDTLYICDTITLSEPIFVQRVRLDSVLVPVTDTLRRQDTLYVYLEREQIQWQDSLCKVYASGINPQVDSVMHYTRNQIITREIDVPVKIRSRWGIGLQAGYGVSKDGMSPYIGAGLTYNVLSW